MNNTQNDTSKCKSQTSTRTIHVHKLSDNLQQPFQGLNQLPGNPVHLQLLFWMCNKQPTSSVAANSIMIKYQAPKKYPWQGYSSYWYGKLSKTLQSKLRQKTRPIPTIKGFRGALMKNNVIKKDRMPQYSAEMAASRMNHLPIRENMAEPTHT